MDRLIRNLIQTCLSQKRSLCCPHALVVFIIVPLFIPPTPNQSARVGSGGAIQMITAFTCSRFILHLYCGFGHHPPGSSPTASRPAPWRAGSLPYPLPRGPRLSVPILHKGHCLLATLGVAGLDPGLGLPGVRCVYLLPPLL